MWCLQAGGGIDDDTAMQAHRFIFAFLLTFLRRSKANDIKSYYFFWLTQLNKTSNRLYDQMSVLYPTFICLHSKTRIKMVELYHFN